MWCCDKRREVSGGGRQWFLVGGFIMSCQSATGCAGPSATTRSHLSLTDNWWAPDLVAWLSHTSFVHSAAKQHWAASLCLVLFIVFVCLGWGRRWEGKSFCFSLTQDTGQVEMFLWFLCAFRRKRGGSGYITSGRASPCAVSLFPPIGGNFWEAPLSERRWNEKEQVKPTEKSEGR